MSHIHAHVLKRHTFQVMQRVQKKPDVGRGQKVTRGRQSGGIRLHYWFFCNLC